MTLRELPPFVSTFAPQGDAEWHALRARDVTASVVGALFGTHEFTSPYELWALKSGRLLPEDISNVAIERGRLLEPVAVALMREERPAWEITHNTGPGRYYRDGGSRIGATPDTLVTCPERGPGTVQIKSVEAGTFRRKWLQDDGETVEPPLWIAMQAILEAHLTGSRWAAVAPIVVGHGIEMPIVDIPLEPEVVPAIYRKAAEFWALVDSGAEPPADYDRDRAVIEAMHRVDDGGEVDLVADRRAYALIEARARALDARAAAEGELERIDAELKHKMGGAALAYLPGGLRMTWKTTRKRMPSGRVSAFRVLRVPRPADLVLDEREARPAPRPAPPRPKPDAWDF